MADTGELSGKQQQQRIEWQRKQPLDVLTRMSIRIERTSVRHIVAEHGEAKASYLIGEVPQALQHVLQRAGKRRVNPVAPQWYTVVKTDTTDRLARIADNQILRRKNRIKAGTYK